MVGAAVTDRPAASSGTFAVLMAAALAVSMAYGATLPLLPPLMDRSMPGSPASAATHVGWLTGLYTIGLLLCSPLWGALADRIDRRWVAAAGLVGAAAGLGWLAGSPTMTGLYVSRLLAGVFSAAVLPAVFAHVVATSAQAALQRRFAWIATATALGFLLGPSMADADALMAASGAGYRSPALVAGIVLLAAIAIVLLPPHRAASKPVPAPAGAAPRVRQALLTTFAAVFGVTVLEIGTTLLIRYAPSGVRWPVSAYFALCSVTMIAVQLWAYPRLEKALGEPRMVTLALAVMTLGLALAALPVTAALPMAFVLAAVGIGVVIPALAVRISAVSGTRQGWGMGRQAAAANLGQAVGSALTGSLFAWSAPLPFIAAAGVLALGVFVLARDVRRTRR